MSTCPACRAPTIPEASFCAVCGEKLPEHGAGQSLDAYQRILTLVFVDLVRATQASQSLDLDAYDDLIGNLHGMVDQVVESYRGMVLQRYGDGVLACFGHRRDGEDAVLAGTSAALSLARQSPNRLGGRHVRVGVHAGQVMCRLDQGGRLMPQVTGLHVNLAARLQEQAEIGGVAITWSSLAGLSRLAKVEASAPRSVVLKGIDAPVELVDVSDLTLLGQSLNQPALLERDEVLSQINGARLGDGPGFAITGPAGMGKSSILSGLSGAQAGDVAAIYISARASLSEAPLAPVRATLAKLFDPSSDVAALNADLTAKGLDSTEQEVAVLAHLLHPSNPLPVSLTPEKIRSLSIDVAARVLMHHHRTTTARLLFDDLHWADTDTLACLEKVIAADVVPPSHLIATGRGQPRVQEFIERTGLTEIALAPLSDDASARLIRSELGLDTGMVARIVDMAEGNPLYTLALARHAAQLGPHAENTELPTSIEATFQSIIDACGPQKDVVLMASILGRLVEPRHLRHLLPDRAQLSDELDGLKIEGILQSGPDGLQFGHVLMRDAAYNMIPARRRRSLHAQLANALRTAEPDLCATYPQILADHSLAAEDHDLIPGDCIVAGMHVLRDAGFAPAIRYFASAIESIETAHGDGAKAHPAYLPALSLEASARVQKDGFAHPNVLKSYNRLESAVQGDASVSMERMAALYGLFAHRVISGQLRSCRPMVDEMAR
ncbi:MAG: AAA family ATPase, partial [Pseudomonadota bacterium]